MNKLPEDLQASINAFLGDANALKEALQEDYDTLEALQEERETEARSAKMDALQEKIDTLENAIDAVESIE